MDQFKPKTGQRPSDILGAAKSIVGNDPRAALQRMAASGMTCNLPDGRTVPIADLIKLADGSTPQQFLSKLGLR
jgi:hypothetical protein